LHFGLLSNQPQSGRLFGGVGAMIDSPGFTVAAEPAERTSVAVTSDKISHAERDEIERRATQIASHKPTECIPWASGGIHIEIRRFIPPHIGLGAGTQLALAVAKALAALAGDNADAVELAKRAGRGARSALGIHGFQRGGLMIDGGKSDSDSVGVLAARTDLPPAWRFLLMTPKSTRGLSGEAERDAFGRLPPMNPAVAKRLMKIADQELKIAAEANDFDAFSDALYEFGHTVGEYFAAVQGGVFAHPDMRQLAGELREQGIRGIAQTSWGPTIFAVTASVQGAEQLARRLAEKSAWRDLSLHIAAPLNSGARVQVEN
jgi:beta-RFAP synthase